MIPRGHKVVVLSSSTTKSGTKIRKGSVGFVAGIGKTHDFSRQQMYITPAKIVFTRYGHENAQRNETKFVTLIHPAVDSSKVTHVQRTLNTLTANSLDMLDKIKKLFITEGVTIKPAASIVVTKSYKGNYLLNNLNNLKAWTSSVLQGGALHPIVLADQFSNLNIAKGILTKGCPEFETKLKYCVLYRKQSNKFIDSIANNQELQILLIKRLKGFLILKERKDVLNYTKEFNNHWMNKDIIFHLLWYFLSNNVKLPVAAKKVYGIKTHKANIELWMKLFESIK